MYARCLLFAVCCLPSGVWRLVWIVLDHRLFDFRHFNLFIFVYYIHKVNYTKKTFHRYPFDRVI